MRSHEALLVGCERREPSRNRVFIANYPETTSVADFKAAFPGVAEVNMRNASATLTFDSVESAEAAVARNGEVVLGDLPQRIEFMRK